MIEMLGVLAIIGVLSVGGIAGYSKAMMKHKINQTIDQIAMMSSGIQTFFFSQKNKYIGADNIEVLKKAHLVSPEMIEEKKEFDDNASFSSGANCGATRRQYEESHYLSDADAQYMYESCTKTTAIISTPLGGSLAITAGNKIFSFILSDIPDEACMELATQDWGSASAGFIELNVGGKSTSSGPLSVSDAAVGCDGETNTITMIFK